jgi:hypothetical protein
MRNFAKTHSKKQLFALGAIILYVLIISIPALAEEPETPTTENMQSPLHVLPAVHNSDEWEWETAPPPPLPPSTPPIHQAIELRPVEPWEITDLRIRQVISRDGIIRPLLQSPELQTLQLIYNEKIEMLRKTHEPINNKMVGLNEPEFTILLNSTISLQEFILLTSINQKESYATNEAQNGFNHWQLALSGMGIALLIVLIFAKAWGK